MDACKDQNATTGSRITAFVSATATDSVIAVKKTAAFTITAKSGSSRITAVRYRLEGIDILLPIFLLAAAYFLHV